VFGGAELFGGGSFFGGLLLLDLSFLGLSFWGGCLAVDGEPGFGGGPGWCFGL